jgi:predicted RNA-binding protein associated with RNAse of E/G family
MLNFYLDKSTKPNKKYMVSFINPNTNRINNIHFGQKKYSDMTIHKDENRKKRYIARASVQQNTQNITKPAFWALNLLWNKPTIEESIKDIEKRYPHVKILDSD